MHAFRSSRSLIIAKRKVCAHQETASPTYTRVKVCVVLFCMCRYTTYKPSQTRPPGRCRCESVDAVAPGFLQSQERTCVGLMIERSIRGLCTIPGTRVSKNSSLLRCVEKLKGLLCTVMFCKQRESMTPPNEAQRETVTLVSGHGFWLTSYGTFTPCRSIGM